MDLFSITTAAAALAVDKSTISRHAARLGLGQRVGAAVVLSTGDLGKLRKALAAARPGNPNFVPGNRFGRPNRRRKKSS